MKKLLYINYSNIEEINTDGIAKKILSQINAMNTLGYEVDYSGQASKSSILISKNRVISQRKNRIYEPMRVSTYKHITKHLKQNNTYEVAYIRGLNGNLSFIILLYLLKKNNIRTIIEVPTYPREIDTLKNFKIKNIIHFILDKFFTRFVKYMDIDRFLLIGNQALQYKGVNASVIPNGIDITQYELRKYPIQKELHVAAVAHINFKHGYDRFIEGLNIYYKNNPSKKVYLHIVGSNADYLKKMVNQYDLEEYVVFYGVLGGSELDSVLNKCQIALGALAFHRNGNFDGSTLKVKEYCARGIPFVISYNEIGLDENDNFFLKVPANEEPICIQDVVNFEKRIAYNINEHILAMRNIVEQLFSWEKILEPYL